MRFARIRDVATMVLAVVGVAGCAAAGEHSSPWEWGGGVYLAPGFAVTPARTTTLHPVASWTYLDFDGGNDQIFALGGQIRQHFGMQADGRGGFWIGGEGAFARLRTSIDGGGSASTNGWTADALVGFPVGRSRWGINLYAGAGFNHFGTTGKNVRAGVDLQPWFLRRSATP
jgi:hypothetical protein